MFSSHLLSPQRDKLSPCEVEGSLDKPVDLDNQHVSQPYYYYYYYYHGFTVRYSVLVTRTENAVIKMRYIPTEGRTVRATECQTMYMYSYN